MKTILVLSNYYASTMRWILSKFSDQISELHHNNNRVYLKDGTQLLIVSSIEQMKGLDYKYYIKAPDYVTMEDEAHSRGAIKIKYEAENYM